MSESIKGLPPELQHLSLQGQQGEVNKELGQNEFLELMLTQLQHQDPLNPMESGDFLAQLAQFGTVNGITELQNSFGALADSLQSNQALQASTLVGRTVTVPGNTAPHESGDEFKGGVDLTSPVDNLTVSIHDSAGQLIQQLNYGPQSSGIMHFSWNGVDSNGQQAASGTYQISAQGSIGGEEISFGTLVSAKVESVTLARNGGDPSLNLGSAGTVTIGEISELL